MYQAKASKQGLQELPHMHVSNASPVSFALAYRGYHIWLDGVH